MLLRILFITIFVAEIFLCFSALLVHLIEISFMALWGVFVVGALADKNAALHALIYLCVLGAWLGFSALLHLLKIIIGNIEVGIGTANSKTKLFLCFWLAAILLGALPIFIDWEGVDSNFLRLFLLPVLGTLHTLYLAREYLGLVKREQCVL